MSYSSKKLEPKEVTANKINDLIMRDLENLRYQIAVHGELLPEGKLEEIHQFMENVEKLSDTWTAFLKDAGLKKQLGIKE